MIISLYTLVKDNKTHIINAFEAHTDNIFKEFTGKFQLKLGPTL